MNTEKMIIVEKNGEYINRLLGFRGSLEGAMEFAEEHNFGGGVEIWRIGNYKNNVSHKEA